MSTYDDNLLAARFAALAPEPLPGNWDDVLDTGRRSESPSAARAPRAGTVGAGFSSCSR